MGLDVARGRELRAAAGMGNASVEQMADRFLGYPGICKPREVAMSAWHAPRLSLDQVQYASVDAYLAFRLGVVLLCPGGAAPPPPPARAQQRAPAIVYPACRAPVVVHAAPPVQRAPAVVVQPAPRLVAVRAAPAELFGVPVPAVGGDAAITGGKVMGTHAGVIDDSDTESEMDSYDDVYRAATRGLPVRAYASDSDYSLDSSDGFEDVRFGVFTDEEDEEDDGSYIGTGSPGADDIDGNEEDDEDDEEGCNEGDQADEEGCNEDDLEDEEDCNQDGENDEEGCNEDDLEDEEDCNQDGENDEGGYADEDQNDEEGYNEDDQEGYNYTSGAGMDGSAELVSNEVVIDGCEDDALAQDDWYDQEVDYGFDQEVDYGFDQDDEQEFEEFCLL